MGDFNWGSLIQSGLGLMGQMGAAQGQAAESQRAAELEEDRYNARKEAYDRIATEAAGDENKGETNFNAESNTALPELGMMTNQINSQATEAQTNAAGQMGANLAAQGQRGGQAATLLNRGTGEIAKGALQDVNKMKFAEAQNRANKRMDFSSGQAKMAQNARYQAPTF